MSGIKYMGQMLQKINSGKYIFMKKENEFFALQLIAGVPSDLRISNLTPEQNSIRVCEYYSKMKLTANSEQFDLVNCTGSYFLFQNMQSRNCNHIIMLIDGDIIFGLGVFQSVRKVHFVELLDELYAKIQAKNWIKLIFQKQKPPGFTQMITDKYIQIEQKKYNYCIKNKPYTGQQYFIFIQLNQNSLLELNIQRCAFIPEYFYVVVGIQNVLHKNYAEVLWRTAFADRVNFVSNIQQCNDTTEMTYCIYQLTKEKVKSNQKIEYEQIEPQQVDTGNNYKTLFKFAERFVDPIQVHVCYCETEYLFFYGVRLQMIKPIQSNSFCVYFFNTREDTVEIVQQLKELQQCGFEVIIILQNTLKQQIQDKLKKIGAEQFGCALDENNIFGMAAKISKNKLFAYKDNQQLSLDYSINDLVNLHMVNQLQKLQNNVLQQKQAKINGFRNQRLFMNEKQIKITHKIWRKTPKESAPEVKILVTKQPEKIEKEDVDLKHIFNESQSNGSVTEFDLRMIAKQMDLNLSKLEQTTRALQKTQFGFEDFVTIMKCLGIQYFDKSNEDEAKYRKLFSDRQEHNLISFESTVITISRLKLNLQNLELAFKCAEAEMNKPLDYQKFRSVLIEMKKLSAEKQISLQNLSNMQTISFQAKAMEINRNCKTAVEKNEFLIKMRKELILKQFDLYEGQTGRLKMEDLILLAEQEGISKNQVDALTEKHQIKHSVSKEEFEVIMDDIFYKPKSAE
ncbi:Conserved_hypothetical protein [Hexamita inflata]|uniref:Uncharacterized protein n=1 Tax=Hexamita inflata TaxID=28002 RepID=A0AA86QQV1_9EUKA|nr:Conserved hypothetical protein [Hexamita inflata]